MTTYTTKKVFDVADSRMDEHAQPIQQAMGGMMEFNCVGNDSYHDWEVDATEYGGNGGGYVTDKQQACVNAWVKANGAEPGENILLLYGW